MRYTRIYELFLLSCFLLGLGDVFKAKLFVGESVLPCCDVFRELCGFILESCVCECSRLHAEIFTDTMLSFASVQTIVLVE